MNVLLLLVQEVHGLSIVSNRVQPGGAPVDTVSQLQALLDAHPNTAFRVSKSRWRIDEQEPKSIWLRDNRTLLMDASTVIEGSVVVPSTEKQPCPGGHVTGYGALLTVSGNNIDVVGGRFVQSVAALNCTYAVPAGAGACNFAVDIFRSSGVTFRDTVVEGSFMSAVRVQEEFWPPSGQPPVASHWSTLAGLAKQPVLITNVTLLHHSNESLFQLRGFWLVMAQNVIMTSNTILGPFMYSIDLDSSSSANVVHRNYMNGCVWEGIFTEYSAVHNVITGNTVIGDVVNNQHIHINGYLNVVVDNTVRVNATTPGGIACTSQLKMYGSYALSNRIVGNSAGKIILGGDGGCDNYVAENRANVSVAGSPSAGLQYWLQPVPNASADCIAGVDTTAPAVRSTYNKSCAMCVLQAH